MTKRYTLPDISLFQIQLFLSVAEERNFSRAAEIMHLTQPALSKRIVALENAVGLQLIDRDTRPISLTGEGEILYEQWQGLCQQVQQTIDKAYHYHSGKKIPLTVCWYDSGEILSTLPEIERQMIARYSNLSLRMVFSQFLKWRNRLIRDEIDIMITLKMETEHLNKNFDWCELVSCPKLVCMLKTNPLADKESITFDDLRDQKFVMLSPIETPLYQNYVQDLCLAHGFIPEVSRYALNANSLVSCLEDNDDVLICDQFLRNAVSPYLKTFELPNVTSGLVAVWKKDSSNPFIHDFVSQLKQYHSP